MNFIRHVGKHGDRKVAVIFREVPGESHMCLVTYTELLGQTIHDPMMKAIESAMGQQSENLADALSRSYTVNGSPILQTLHAEGKIKKIHTEAVLMTPAPNTTIKLSELNKMLDEMKLGEEAIKKLSEMDSSLGMQSPQAVARRMKPEKTPAPRGIAAGSGDVLGDSALAKDFLSQAARMESEAKGLLAEAARLTSEAKSLDPVLAKKSGTVKKVSVAATKPTTKERKSKVKVAA